MSRNKIIYCGGFKLPDGTASAQRAIGNAHMLAGLGYEVILAGKPNPPSFGGDISTVHRFETDGFESYNIEAPDGEREYSSYTKSGETIERICELAGKDKVLAILAYNYAPRGVAGILKFARPNGIIPAVDTTEWYGLEVKSPMGIFRFLSHEYRMRVLQKKVGNLICGSRYIRDFYKDLNTVIVPNCVDMNHMKWSMEVQPDPDPRRRFVYVGSPGPKMSKEDIAGTVKAFAMAKEGSRPFVFHVVGVAQKDLLKFFPDSIKDIETLGDSIVFHGRLPHLEAIGQIRKSDFFIFMRPRTRVTEAGCPTKLGEAFAAGVPTVTNQTGDVEVYMHSPLHGFVAKDHDASQLSDAIRKALQVDDDHLTAMKAACKADNPFRYELYGPAVKEFFNRAR